MGSVKILLHPALPHCAEMREYLIVQSGLENHPEVELVDSADDADLIFFTCRSVAFGDFDVPMPYDPKKVVFVDWGDSSTECYNVECHMYFKRSWFAPDWFQDTDKFVYFKRYKKKWPAHYRPFTYAVDRLISSAPKTIDLGCYVGSEQYNRRHAVEMCGCIYHNNKLIAQPEPGKEAYFEMLKRTRIIVTCQPDKCSGDIRTWEAFAARALVCVDRLPPLSHPFVDGKHCIIFEPTKLGFRELKGKIEYYLQHLDEAEEIATQGHEHAITYHRAVDRVGEMIDLALGRKNEIRASNEKWRSGNPL